MLELLGIIIALLVYLVILQKRFSSISYKYDRAVAQTAMVINDYNFVVDNRIFAIVKNNAGEIYFFCFVPKTYKGFEFQLCKLENNQIQVIERSDYFSDPLYSAWLATFDKERAKKFYIRMATYKDVDGLKKRRKEAIQKAQRMFQ